MENKKQSWINALITFLMSFTFLVLNLFIFETIGWNVAYYNIFSLIKIGVLFGLFNVSAHYLSAFIIAYKMRGLLQNLTSLNPKQLSKIIISKLAVEFILSALAIWLSIEVLSNEIIVGGIGTLIGLIVSTIITKGIFSLFVSYQQNKDQLGGMR